MCSFNESLIPLDIYRVHVVHPDSWHIYINPSKPFDFHDGFVKIDQSAAKKDNKQASITVRWAKLDRETNIDEYMDELKSQYEKKQKKNKKDRYEIMSIEPVEGLPHKSYLMNSSIRTNHSVYRSLGREELVRSMQLTTYCDVTERLVIASVSAYPQEFDIHMEDYKYMLLNLKCH